MTLFCYYFGFGATDSRKNLAADIESYDAKVKVEDSLPTIIGHAATLEIIMQNLVSNAIKFVAPSIRPEIYISATESPSSYQFSVHDNGIGIDKAHATGIFKIFERLHTDNEYPGTGIGLAIAKKAVSLHEGKLWFDSNETGGSTFYFTISKNIRHSGSQ